MRTHPVVSLFAASLIMLTPMHAFAQTPEDDDPFEREENVSVRDRERPDFDPLGTRAGSFVLNAALDLDVFSTDNLFVSRPALAIDETFFEATARGSLRSDWSRHALALDGAWTARRHEDQTGEDTDAYHLRAIGRLDVGARSAVHGSVRAAHQVTPRTDPDISDMAGMPVEYDRFDVTAGVSHRFARAEVRADVGRSDYDYEAGQNFRDNEETFLRGRIDVEVSPRLQVVAEAAADERDYNNTPTLSSEGRSVLGGVALTGNVVRGEVLVGHFERDYEDAAIGSVDGVAASAQVEWYVTRLTTVTVDGRRNADDQISGTAGLPFVTSEYGARVDHELRRNVILSASARKGERDYEPLSRQDEYTEYAISADWLVSRRVALRARIERDEIEYTGVSIDDRDVATATIGVSLRL